MSISTQPGYLLLPRDESAFDETAPPYMAPPICTGVHVAKALPDTPGLKQKDVEASASAHHFRALSPLGLLRLPDADARVVRVRAIVDRLAPFIQAWLPRAHPTRWSIDVYQHLDPEAKSWASGQIFLTSSLIDKLKLTDDELASVIAHKMAHVQLEHARENQHGKNALLGIVGALVGAFSPLGAAQGKSFGEHSLRFTRARQQESDADLVGAEVLARAGFNPNAASGVLGKFAAYAQEGAVAQWTRRVFDRHPPDDDRLRLLSRELPCLNQLYEAARNNAPHATDKLPEHETSP